MKSKLTVIWYCSHVKEIFSEGVKMGASQTPILVKKEPLAFFIIIFYISNEFFYTPTIEINQNKIQIIRKTGQYKNSFLVFLYKQ